MKAIASIVVFCVSVCLPARGQSDSQRIDNFPTDRRIALVIGNADYSYGSLKSPINDAHAIGRSLRDLGFETVIKDNASLRVMLDSMRDFTIKAQNYHIRLFYYAGHGIQFKGRNFLVPIETEIRVEDDIPAKTVDVSEFLDRLGQVRTGLNLVVLDACRNNPFSGQSVIGPDGRVVRLRATGTGGLAHIDAPQGTFVAFSTAPGAVAFDGNATGNSLYTKHLVANIGLPNIPVEQLFKRVRVAVSQETKRMQIPWESSSLMADFCFKQTSSGKCGFVDLEGKD
jgi:uncharacterized caspase-like protein